MKTCFKCETEKPLTEFYRHTQMADGRLNKCKTCTKADARKNGQRPEVRARERERAKLPHRVAARAKYHRENRKVINSHQAVFRALRRGDLVKPDRCSECGVACSPRGHHDDYDKPLDVRWLCNSCHMKWHEENEPMNMETIG